MDQRKRSQDDGFVATTSSDNAPLPSIPPHHPAVPTSTLETTESLHTPAFSDWEEQAARRVWGFGDLHVLPDKVIKKILKSTASSHEVLAFGAVSRACHQVANWSELWRALCLERWGGDFTYRYSWKITHFWPKEPMMGGDEDIPELLLPHSPSRIFIRGFFSQSMYDAWRIATHFRDMSHWHIGHPLTPAAAPPPHHPTATEQLNGNENEGNDVSEEEEEEEEEDDDDDEEGEGEEAAYSNLNNHLHHPHPHPYPYPHDAPDPLSLAARLPAAMTRPIEGGIERIHFGAMSVEELKTRYINANRPFILTGIVPQWRAAGANVPPSRMSPPMPSGEDSDDDTNSDDSDDDTCGGNKQQSPPPRPPWAYEWTPKKLVERFGSEYFKINSYSRSGRRIKMTLRDYWLYMQRNTDAFPLYIFDSKFGERIPDLLDDYWIPEVFWEDLYAALPDMGPASIRPPYRWILMGPARSGTPYHTDPHGTSAWNALLYGKKRWALYPPTDAGAPLPPGIDPVTQRSSHPLLWYTNVYSTLGGGGGGQPPPIEFVQEPGDFLFVPSGWWHCVLNITDTVAVTQNFVNMANLDAVIAHMLTQADEHVLQLWKLRLTPLRPELHKIIDVKIAQQKGFLAQHQLAQMQEKIRRKEAKWASERDSLKREIELLKSQLAHGNSGTGQ